MTGSVFKRATNGLSNLLVVLARVAIIAMMVHVVVDVAAKYLLGIPIVGTLEIVSTYYMVAVVFLPIAFVQLQTGGVLRDTVVLVTGAGHGIGREIALLAAAEGASVLVNVPA